MGERKIAKTNRGFKGIWIPASYWLDENLTIQEMLFLAEIDSLDIDEKGCYASNKHFSDFFGLSKSRVSEVISSLQKKNYISLEFVYKGKEIEKRTIKVFGKPKRGIRKTEEGYSEKAKGSNTSFSNTKDNMSSSEKIPFKKIIDHLNQVTGSRFSSKSSDTQKHIKARWNEGNTFEDFISVIDVKNKQWKDNSEMSKYLRPSTLFSAKNFENYKGEAIADKKKNQKPKANDIDLNELDKLFGDAS
ncbi:conserved phage C-terminal domain-containing protein [Enterococcus durans]|uniref:conserved phage C-terminal domain-containing protein n=1 Tax=Enterococcus durans TaxID=53345 RepID=UPI00189E5D26|nr:conserved phage C-terminal domain-containing protein [Enterococcus durans]MDB1686254.1 conserved phage C-terminal domain-containing protein [Enterococcus durans]